MTQHYYCLSLLVLHPGYDDDDHDYYYYAFSTVCVYDL